MVNLRPCQPSIQKLVNSVANDAIANLAEETTRTDAYTESAPQVKMAVDALRTELSPDVIDDNLLNEAHHKSIARGEAREKRYTQTVSLTRYVRMFTKRSPSQISAIAEIALRPTTHVRTGVDFQRCC